MGHFMLPYVHRVDPPCVTCAFQYSGETFVEKFYRKSATYRARKKNAELHSLRCDVELKLAVARKFLNEDRLYFPHNIDFRYTI